jgi:hypothetical protein
MKSKGKHGGGMQFEQREANFHDGTVAHEPLEKFMDQGHRGDHPWQAYESLPESMNQGGSNFGHPSNKAIGKGDKPMSLGGMMGQR